MKKKKNEDEVFIQNGVKLHVGAHATPRKEKAHISLARSSGGSDSGRFQLYVELQDSSIRIQLSPEQFADLLSSRHGEVDVELFGGFEPRKMKHIALHACDLPTPLAKSIKYAAEDLNAYPKVLAHISDVAKEEGIKQASVNIRWDNTNTNNTNNFIIRIAELARIQHK